MLQVARERPWGVGILTGALLGGVVSGGIVMQRVAGTPVTAVVANAVTTVAAVVAVYASVRVCEERPRAVAVAQGVGAAIGIVLVHVLLRRQLVGHPWIHEQPRQLVNDVAGTVGMLTVVWGCARRVLQPAWMIAGLVLLGAYELTARYWHIDAATSATALPWSIQRFVGSEVTASGLGVVIYRVLFG